MTKTEDRMSSPCGPDWTPVVIAARTPETSDAQLHHAHCGVACSACEIVALRELVGRLVGILARLDHSAIALRDGNFDVTGVVVAEVHAALADPELAPWKKGRDA